MKIIGDKSIPELNKSVYYIGADWLCFSPTGIMWHKFAQNLDHSLMFICSLFSK